MRQTLARMTHQQFAELRIDVYDELLRRKSGCAGAGACVCRGHCHIARWTARR